jgi:predicted transcriptional regulator
LAGTSEENIAVALTLPPELEQRVTALARETSRKPEDVLTELVEVALADDAAFGSTVREGLAQLDRGETVPHDDVMVGVRGILRARVRDGRAAYARGDLPDTTPDEFMDGIARELELLPSTPCAEKP